MKKRVLVVGGGLGGMSAAISLASRGYAVTVVEKNDKLGGKLNVLKQEGFTFDLGPSILTLPHYFEALFAMSGKRMADYVKIVPVSPHWRNFFEDGRVVDLYKDDADMARELKKLPRVAGSSDADLHFKEYRRFLDYAKVQFDIVERGYFAKGLDDLWDFLKFYGVFNLGLKIDHRRTMAQSIDRHFSSPYLKDIFEYFIKYVGSSALNAPGYMNLMPIIQTEFDLWYVEGGMYNLARALERLMGELGIVVKLGREVVRLESGSGLLQSGVLDGGERVEADFVVSNMEVVPAYRKLLGESDGFMKSFDKFEPACSGIVIHLGTKKKYPQLAHHNFFFSKQQHKHFRTVFDERKLPEDPTIYLVAPTRTDPSQAPEGCDNIKVLPHIPHIDPKNPYTVDDYAKLKDRVLDKLERMGLTDLRKNTIVEDFWTPFDIEKKYYSNRGSIYGVVSDWKKNYGFKAPKRSKKYKNLYFVGGSVNPGGGMPMVALCGQNVANMIVSDDRP